MQHHHHNPNQNHKDDSDLLNLWEKGEGGNIADADADGALSNQNNPLAGLKRFFKRRKYRGYAFSMEERPKGQEKKRIVK